MRCVVLVLGLVAVGAEPVQPLALDAPWLLQRRQTEEARTRNPGGNPLLGKEIAERHAREYQAMLGQPMEGWATLVQMRFIARPERDKGQSADRPLVLVVRVADRQPPVQVLVRDQADPVLLKLVPGQSRVYVRGVYHRFDQRLSDRITDVGVIDAQVWLERPR